MKPGSNDRESAKHAADGQRAIADRRFAVGDPTPEQEAALEKEYGLSWERALRQMGKEPGE